MVLKNSTISYTNTINIIKRVNGIKIDWWSWYTKWYQKYSFFFLLDVEIQVKKLD